MKSYRNQNRLPDSGISLRVLAVAVILQLVTGCSGFPAIRTTETSGLKATMIPPAAAESDIQPSSTPFQEPTQGVVYAVTGIVPDGYLDMYRNPSDDAEVIGRLPATGVDLIPGSSVQPGANHDWMLVSDQDASGWVDASHLAEQHGTAPAEIIELGLTVLDLLRSYRYEQLGGLIHPEQCLRLSPYPYLGESSLRFCAADLDTAPSSDQLYDWGWYDGSGEPIKLTFHAYHDRFIYDADFLQAPVVGFNIAVSSGNSIDNLPDLYPDGMMMEYYYPGFDPQYGGMDWRSLKLVFVQEEGTWYLVAIVHGEWTI
jgi:hypothetical protein